MTFEAILYHPLVISIHALTRSAMLSAAQTKALEAISIHALTRSAMPTKRVASCN